jgi:uncharacterized delta-60 repeat protein
VIPDLSVPYDAYADDVAIDSTGRVVVSGAVQTTADDTYESDFAFVRLDTGGALDASFDGDANNGNGIVTVSFFTGNEAYEEAYAVDVLPSDDIVAAGYAWPGGSAPDEIGLVRLEGTDGTLDSGFDDDGRVTTSVAPNSIYANDLLIDGSKLVVTGPSGPKVMLARYEASDGSLDSGFGTDGIRTDSPPSPFTGAQARAIAVDGSRYLVGGEIYGAENDIAKGAMFAARYNAGGGLDSLFGGDGFAVADTAKDDPVDDANQSFEGAFDVAPVDDGNALTDNKVLLAGRSTPGGAENLDFTLARLGPDVTAPVTRITRPKKKTSDHTPAVKFKVDDPEATSRCRIDKKDWIDPCVSGDNLGRLGSGSHVVSVESTDLDGNVESPPAKHRFKVT